MEAEELSEVSEKCKIIAVPTVIVLQAGNVVDRVDGASPGDISKMVTKHAVTTLSTIPPPAATSSAGGGGSGGSGGAADRAKAMVSSNPVFVFMKGTPTSPSCGFSAKLIDLLGQVGVDRASLPHFDILSDQEIRAAVKEMANFPTYPQLWVNGKLVGGLDICTQLHEDGDLAQVVSEAKPAASLEDKLAKLVKRGEVMLFMKGKPEAPKCGFSRTIVGILNDARVKFDSFDILEDEEVRQGLKEFSKWPTYPQLYVNGKLIGGLDIVKELVAEEEFDALIPASAKLNH